MNKFPLLIVLCTGFLLWTACTTDDNQTTPLSDAIHVVDDNPQEALALLENIIDPELLSDSDKDQYMQYIVILTQARYMDYQDITGDSLILDAQRYFAKKQDYKMAARASYYAAAYWQEEDIGDKVMGYWQAAISFAERAGNNLFMAKSAYSLGQSYFNQEQWEDAMIYCQKALELYDNRPDPEHYKLDITEMIGQIYRKQHDFEQAYVYFDNGLKTAQKLNNVAYESRFLRNKGIIHWEKKEYPKSKEYFDLALSKQPEPEDKLRIYLSYAKLYRAMNCPDSTLYYLSMIKEHISEINYSITIRDIYTELVTYCQSNGGDISEIAHWLLAHFEDLRIKNSLNEKKIEATNQQFEQLRHNKQTESRKYHRMFNYGLVALCLLASMLVVIEVNKHKLREKYRQIRQKLFSHVIDQQHFLLAGLRSVAKSTDDLQQRELAYDGSPAWEQQLVLRQEFMIQIAECTRQDLERLRNGKKVLSELTPEDLSIIHMSRTKLSDENIGWMLGRQGYKEQYIMIRKGQIRQIMTDAGMRNRDIRMLVP